MLSELCFGKYYISRCHCFKYFSFCQVSHRISGGGGGGGWKQLIPQLLCYLSIKCDLCVTLNIYNYLLWALLKDTCTIQFIEKMLSWKFMLLLKTVIQVKCKHFESKANFFFFVHLYLNFSIERKISEKGSYMTFKSMGFFFS